MSTTPIADHALLSDRHSGALVTTSGSVDWLAFPRFDSPAVLGRLLGDEAGHWQMSPVGRWTSSRRYLDRTLVLETTFSTTAGTLVLTDAMALGQDNGGHRLGSDVPHLLVRKLACTLGEVEVEVDYQPRPEYGLIVPLLTNVAGGVTARGGAEWLVLTADGLSIDGPRAHGRRTLRAGEQVYLALHRSTLEETPARVWSQADLAEVLTRTVEAWRSWSALAPGYDGPWADLVHHSGLVLQGLSFQPSGAIVAAATTSLPEATGGERNWDYRYRLGPRLELHHGGAVGRRVPGRGRRLLRLHDHRGRLVVGPGRRVADHVRRRRRARPVRARAGPPGLAGATAARSGSATVRGTSSRSTCTANCSARPPARRPAHRARRRHQALPGRRVPTRPPRTGGRRTRASGRCAAIRSTSSTPRSCAGWRSTALWRWPIASTPATGSTGGRRRGTRSARRCSGTAGASRPARSPSTSAATALDAVQPDDADRRLPAGRRPADARDDRRDRRSGSPTTAGWSTATGRRAASTGSPARRAPSSSAPSGLPRRSPSQGSSTRARAVFERAIAFVNDVGLLAEEVDAVYR